MASFHATVAKAAARNSGKVEVSFSLECIRLRLSIEKMRKNIMKKHTSVYSVVRWVSLFAQSPTNAMRRRSAVAAAK